jgi:hypothetical protein
LDALDLATTDQHQMIKHYKTMSNILDKHGFFQGKLDYSWAFSCNKNGLAGVAVA